MWWLIPWLLFVVALTAILVGHLLWRRLQTQPWRRRS
jgi:hypothetical protein